MDAVLPAACLHGAPMCAEVADAVWASTDVLIGILFRNDILSCHVDCV